MALFFRHDGSITDPIPFSWDGQPSALTAEQVDETIATLAARIQEIDDNFNTGVILIDDITVDDPLHPTMFTITLTDYRTFDIPLPVAAFNPVGPWTNGMSLSRLDLFEAAGFGTYYVLQNHTTPVSGPFDPTAELGGEPLYQLLFNQSATMAFTGEYGAQEYQLYSVFTDDEWGTWVVLQRHDASGTFDPFLEEGGNPVYAQIAAPIYPPIETVSASTYELSLDDIGHYLRITHADGCVITFPDDVAFPVGAEIHIRQCGDGPITFNEAAGFTINPPREGYDSTSQYKGATFTAKFVTATECDLIGPHGASLVS